MAERERHIVVEEEIEEIRREVEPEEDQSHLHILADDGCPNVD